MTQIQTHKILDTITDDIMSRGGSTVITNMLNDCRYGAISQWDLVREIVRMTFAEGAQSQRHRDMLVGLVDRMMAEELARSLGRLELTAAGLDEEEIEEALRDYPEHFTPEGIEARRPTPASG